MKRYTILYVFPIYVLVVFTTLLPLHAQIYQPRFKQLNIDHGLSQGHVKAFLHDRRGYMWIGTRDGLNLYDGYTIKVYRHNAFDSTSVSGRDINVIYQDDKDCIWIGTDGLNLYVPESDNFRRFLLDANGAGPPVVIALYRDDNDMLWVGTLSGLFLLNIKTGEYKTILHDPQKPNTLSNDNIHSLHADRSGMLWIGTNSGLNTLDLVRYNDESRLHFTRYTNDNTHVHGFTAANVSALYEDSDGTLWVGTELGLFKTRRSSEHGVMFRYIPHQHESLRDSWQGRVVAMTGDKYGNIWLGTSGGLAILDPATEVFQYVFHHPLIQDGLSYNLIQTIYVDNSGKIWIGTVGKGVDIYDQNAKPFYLYRGYPDKEPFFGELSVTGLLEDDAGTIWIASNVDLWRSNRNEPAYEKFHLRQYGNPNIYYTHRDEENRLWFATSDGLFLVYPGIDRIHHYKYNPNDEDGIKSDIVRHVYEDKAGNIWVSNSNYLSKWNEEDNRFIHFHISSIPEEPIITSVGQTGDNVFWIGWTQGLVRYSTSTGDGRSFQNNPLDPASISNNFITSILPDPSRPAEVLWIGTGGGGLNRFDVHSETFEHYTVEDGLPNDYVYGILSDEDRRLWISTNRGVSRVDIQALEAGNIAHAFRNYDVTDGLQSNEFNTGAYYKNDRGELFFGGINGFNIFNPSLINDNLYKPPVVFTDFLLSNQSISFRAVESPLQKPIGETGQIKLLHHENVISFEFASLDFTSPEKNQYAYMLEGFHKEWINAGTNRTATFTNLKPGTYTFRVRGSNNDGVWSHREASIVLVIDPPFWQTWWAYILYAVGAIFVLYLFRRYEMHRITLRNQLRIEHVRRDKMTEMDSLKTRFFANISHELRTPLTLILGPAEQLSSELENEQSRHKSQLIYSNAQRLLRLINQLLDISRLESGSMKLHAGLYDIVPFLKGITTSFSAYAERKRIDLNFTTTETRIALYFDHDKAEKIFINLISNAIKFTPTGGSVSITVSKEKSSAGSHVNISISDTGIGIPSDQLVFVFNRFYQVNGSDSHEQEGTGIGLAFVKELVDLHHGSVSIASEMGTGSVFTVKLPLGMEHLSPDDILDRDKQILDDIPRPAHESIYLDDDFIEDENGTDVQADDNEIMILIVEDNPDLRVYIKEQLKNRYRIIEAANGTEGFSAASDSIPDLIISDVMMPKMDGYEFCQKIKNDQRTSHIPVILLTARAGEKDKYTGLKTGADEYLTKPFSSEELILRIENLIESRRRLREKYSTNVAIKPTDIAVTPVDKNFLEHVLTVIDAHINDPGFSVETFAKHVNLSQSQMHRKLKALTNMSANQFIRSIRMQRALELLKKNAGNVAEVAYMVGYEDPGYFTRTFKNYFQYLPSEVKRE